VGYRRSERPRRLSGSSDDTALLLIRFGAVAVEAPIPRVPPPPPTWPRPP